MRARRHATVPVLAAALLAACATAPLSESLSFAQMQTLNPGVPASWILAEYPFGRVERDDAGRPRRITYPVTDPQGGSQTLVLVVGEDGAVAEKLYSGRVVRPPPQ